MMVYKPYDNINVCLCVQPNIILIYQDLWEYLVAIPSECTEFWILLLFSFYVNTSHYIKNEHYFEYHTLKHFTAQNNVEMTWNLRAQLHSCTAFCTNSCTVFWHLLFHRLKEMKCIVLFKWWIHSQSLHKQPALALAPAPPQKPIDYFSLFSVFLLFVLKLST